MVTENVTVLFTDVVGSTALASSLAPDVADELRRGHLAVLRQAVAESGGVEVKNLGDGLMVVFRAASAALSCAVAMQQGVERDGRGREHAVGLRVGVSSGEVTSEDGDYFGEPIIEAARLCASSAGGQILAGDIVRLTAGRRSRHEWRSLGRVTLKGLHDPVETIEVVWAPLGDVESEPVVPLPGSLAVRPVAGVVGRGTELASMGDAFKRVAAGEGREVLLVSGEPGLGKSTVIAEAARAAFGAGACVLFGHCEEDVAAPYQLFREAFGHFVTHAPQQLLVEHVESCGSALDRLVPVLSRRLPGLDPSTATDPDTERYQLFASVVGLLVMVSDAQPVVLVLDDLQWADRASLQLLHHLVGTDQIMRLFVLATYRDTELSHSHPLIETLAALHRHRAVVRLELAGLDDTAVASLMEAAAGHGLDDAAVRLAGVLHRETDGNAFYVSEMLRHLAETGAIYHDTRTGQWVTAAPPEATTLPASVRTVIAARVARLGDHAEPMLSLAAVIGRDFDLDLLARVTSLPEDDLLDLLDTAIAAALVREVNDAPGHYAFAHALIQHTLYEELGRTRQARAHRQVGTALEELCGDHPGFRIDELARHWSLASRPDAVAKALYYSRRAADAALAALAPSDALQYYTQAIGLYERSDDPDPMLGVDLAVGLGTAQRQTGDAAFRDTLLDAARRAATLGDTKRLAAAVLANNRGTFSSNGTLDTDRIELLEVALDRLATNDPDRALVLAILCSELCYGSSLERRRALADEAIALAESVGDDAMIARVLNTVSFPLLVPPLLEQSLAWTAEALRRAERVGDPYLQFWAAQTRANAAAGAGDIDEMHRCYDMVGSIAGQLDQPLMNWIHAFNCALRAQLAGDTELTEQLANTARAIGSDGGQPDVAVFYGAQMMAVSYDRGTFGEVVPQLEQLVADIGALAAKWIAPWLAVAHVEAGRLGDAHGLLQAFAAGNFDYPVETSWMTAMTQYADVAIACRDPKYVAPLFELLAPYPDRVVATGVSVGASVSHHLGGLATVLGRYDDADTYFARAAEFNDRASANAHAARTNLAWATMLIERHDAGDTDRARDLLNKAQRASAAGGYSNIQRRAVEALQHVD